MLRLRWVRAALSGAAVAVVAIAVAVAAPTFPKLTGRVVDDAHLLSPAATTRITGWLEGFEAATRRQVVVVTVPSLQGTPIEDFGYQLGRTWGIGERDKNTGALLIVAPVERAVRIEVGYGLEGELTDAVSRAIIEQAILPAFRLNDYERGISDGTAALLRILGWNGAPGPTVTVPPADPLGNIAPFVFLAIFIVLVMLRSRGRGGMFLPLMLLSSAGGHRNRGGPSFGGGGGSFGGGGASGHW